MGAKGKILEGVIERKERCKTEMKLDERRNHQKKRLKAKRGN